VQEGLRSLSLAVDLEECPAGDFRKTYAILADLESGESKSGAPVVGGISGIFSSFASFNKADAGEQKHKQNKNKKNSSAGPAGAKEDAKRGHGGSPSKKVQNSARISISINR